MPVRGPERMYASQWRLIDTIYVRVRERAFHKQLITYRNEGIQVFFVLFPYLDRGRLLYRRR